MSGHYIDVQSGEGTNIELYDEREDSMITVDLDTFAEMVKVAFDLPEFTVDDLISALEFLFPDKNKYDAES